MALHPSGATVGESGLTWADPQLGLGPHEAPGVRSIRGNLLLARARGERSFMARPSDSEIEEQDDDIGQNREDVLGLPKRERDYVVPATDAKNQSVRAMCRMQPAYWRIAAEIIASKKYPFRVLGDLFRWCIVDGIKRLAAGAGINSVVAHADTIMTILTDEDYQLQFAENFTAMKRVVDRYIERNATGKARELVTRIRSEIDRMPEGYWRDQYTTEIETKYGAMLDGLHGGGANQGGTGLFSGTDE